MKSVYNVTPLVVWGLIEQNVVIVAACIPTLRPFFRQAFGSKGSSNNSSTGRSGGSGFKLSSKPRPKRLISATELALEETQNNETQFDPETGSNDSGNSRQGIWQTREVIVETDEGPENKRLSDFKKVVPSNMR